MESERMLVQILPLFSGWSPTWCHFLSGKIDLGNMDQEKGLKVRYMFQSSHSLPREKLGVVSFLPIELVGGLW